MTKLLDSCAETLGEDQPVSLKFRHKFNPYIERKIFAIFINLLYSNLVIMFHTETRNAKKGS